MTGRVGENVDLRGARRQGKGVFLRPVTDADMSYLFFVGTSEENLVRWRLRGRTTSPQGFQQFLWSNTDVQMLICRQDSSDPIGHVCSYQTDEISGTSKVAVVLEPQFQRQAWPLEGLYLFLEYLFSTFPFRKLYFEVPGYNIGEFEKFLERHAAEEGRLQDAVFGGGRYWDLVTLTLTRNEWDRFVSSSWGRVVSGAMFIPPRHVLNGRAETAGEDPMSSRPAAVSAVTGTRPAVS